MERESMEFDVVIVGAGPAGLSTACQLIKLAQEKEALEVHVAKANAVLGQGKQPTIFNLEMLYIAGESEADTKTRLEAMYLEIRQMGDRQRAMAVDSQADDGLANAGEVAEHRAQEAAGGGAGPGANLGGGGGPPSAGDGGMGRRSNGGTHTPPGGGLDSDDDDDKSQRRSRSPANRKTGEEHKDRASKGKGGTTE